MSRFIIMRRLKSFINRATNKVFLKTDWYRNVFWSGTTKFWTISSCDYEIINLGSNSGVFSFNYEDLPIKGFNMAIGPQSLVHDFNILKNYFSYLKPGGIVLITLCPFSCLFSPYSKESNFKYYPILHPATIIDFDDAERTRAYKIKQAPFFEMPSYCIKMTIKEVLKKIISNLKLRSQFNYEKNAEMWLQLWKKQFNIKNLDASLQEHHIEEQKNRAETLREMISFCEERKLRPYIVLPPVHASLSSRLSSVFLKSYVYDFIDKAIDNKSILLDYFNDTSFQKDDFFQNSYFMNKNGASKFTKRVLADLGLIK